MKYFPSPLQPKNVRKINTFFVCVCVIISILMELQFQKANGSVNEFHTSSIAKSIIQN